MKIESGKKDLLIALKKVGPIALSAAAKVNPILENLLLEARGDKLYIMAANAGSSGMCKINCKVNEDGKILVNAQKFIALVDTFENALTINADKTKVELLENKSKITLPITDPASYPTQLLDFTNNYDEEFTINGKELKTGLNKVIDFKQWDSYNVMGGISFRTNENVLKLCATDSNIMAIYEIDLAQKPKADFIIPPHFAENVLKALDGSDVIIRVSDKYVCIEFKSGNKDCINNTILKSALINGKYPLYEHFVPKHQNKILSVDKNLFENFIKKVTILAPKTNTTNKTKVKSGANYLTIDCNSITKISFFEKIESFIPAEFEGDPIKIKLSPDYLLKFLKAAEGNKITLKFLEEKSPILFEEARFTGLLMPIFV